MALCFQGHPLRLGPTTSKWRCNVCKVCIAKPFSLHEDWTYNILWHKMKLDHVSGLELNQRIAPPNTKAKTNKFSTTHANQCNSSKDFYMSELLPTSLDVLISISGPFWRRWVLAMPGGQASWGRGNLRLWLLHPMHGKPRGRFSHLRMWWSIWNSLRLTLLSIWHLICILKGVSSKRGCSVFGTNTTGKQANWSELKPYQM